MFGIQQEVPKKVWCLRLDTGNFQIGSTVIENYLGKNNVTPNEGDVVKLVLKGSELRYCLNGKDLGLAYETPEFKNPKVLFQAFVFI